MKDGQCRAQLSSTISVKAFLFLSFFLVRRFNGSSAFHERFRPTTGLVISRYGECNCNTEWAKDSLKKSQYKDSFFIFILLLPISIPRLNFRSHKNDKNCVEDEVKGRCNKKDGSPRF